MFFFEVLSGSERGVVKQRVIITSSLFLVSVFVGLSFVPDDKPEAGKKVLADQ